MDRLREVARKTGQSLEERGTPVVVSAPTESTAAADAARVIEKREKRTQAKTAADVLRSAKLMATRERLESKFALVWHALGGPKMERQHQGVPGRKWAFDFAHLPTQVVVEIDGGTRNKSGHTTFDGYRNDCERDNAATLDGWQVFRLTGQMIDAANVQPIIDFLTARNRHSTRPNQ